MAFFDCEWFSSYEGLFFGGKLLWDELFCESKFCEEKLSKLFFADFCSLELTFNGLNEPNGR